MRDVLLIAAILVGLATTLRYPFAGVLLWTWFTCMDPHQEAYGFVQKAPLNLIIAVVTLGSWLLSKERKTPVFDTTFFLVASFIVWMTINGYFAVEPAWSWPLWDRTWKTMLLGLVVGILATDKVRVHALIWVIVLSLFYYGIKGGIFTLITGGHNHVLGPSNSNIADNNQLAVALLMSLPLANYLRLHSKNIWISRGLLASMALTFIAVIGTYSRGAFIALAGLLFVALLRSKRKLVYLASAVIVVVPAFMFMPKAYYDRLGTISTAASSDESFMGRVMAWHVAWNYAVDHFPFGDGFAGAQRPEVFNYYYPEATTHAAHSIYFEVLGDNGFVGLAIYLGILFLVILNTFRVRRLTRGDPALSWANDLAGMSQLTLFVFCLGGSALSIAYYDVFFILVGLFSAMSARLKASVSQAEQSGEAPAGPAPLHVGSTIAAGRPKPATSA